MEKLREKLRTLKKQGFRLSPIAKEAGISVPLITAFVRGEKNMSADNTAKVEEVLNKIFGGNE